MKYYVVSDIHGYYTEFMDALEKSGFFNESKECKLLILGDIFDRGKEALKLQEFILKLINEEKVILIRGNHEDLFMRLIYRDYGEPLPFHVSNGTFDTALQLTGISQKQAEMYPMELASQARLTPFVQTIIPAMRDYYETDNYVFVHGFLPCDNSSYRPMPMKDWRDATDDQWKDSRWYNGMKIAWYYEPEKTVCCGHWHASYGHCHIEKNGTEFGKDADFSPFFGRKIISIDACTSYSGKVNIIEIED